MRPRLVALSVCLGVCLCVGTALSGPRTGGGKAFYERLICVVPLVGTGTLQDPKRPLFVPVAGEAPAANTSKSKGFADPPAIIAFQSVISDDGQSAIVELIARDRAAFKPVLARHGEALFMADPHLQSSDALLQQLRKYSKNFDLASFLAGGL